MMLFNGTRAYPERSVKLHFLGTTGYHANDSRQTACLMLPEIGVILDAGTGMYRARDLIQTSELHIFLTHAHLDHVIGLTFLFDILVEREDVDVHVYMAEDKISSVMDHLFHKDLFPAQPNFKVFPFDDKPVKLLDGSTLSTIPLVHPGGSLGFRLDWPDRSLAYITDTVASEDAAYTDAITGVDTLIHECYFADGWEEKGTLTGHSCLTPVAQVARKSKAKQVYLVHINPLDEKAEMIDLKSVETICSTMQIANDLQVIDV